jgi:hypothetical protein
MRLVLDFAGRVGHLDYGRNNARNGKGRASIVDKLPRDEYQGRRMGRGEMGLTAVCVCAVWMCFGAVCATALAHAVAGSCPATRSAPSPTEPLSD